MKRFGQIEIITAVIMIVTSLAVPAGAGITWSGDVDPPDPSTWDSETYGVIGYTGTGTMDITGGSDVISRGGYIGGDTGGTGVVTVDGSGSTWTNSESFFVCWYGNGTMNITGGGAVSNSSGSIGSKSGTTGVVTVDGSGSTWTNDGHFFVGASGNGTLNITDGGAVSNSNTGYIGHNSDGTGVVTVDGSSSTWTNSKGLNVGMWGNGTLNITGGGAVSNEWSGSIGYGSGSTSEVTVDGSGSTWTNSSNLDVGHDGNGTLNITGGGLVSVAETLTIDENGGDDSFINMATGGMLAVFGDADDSLFDFMGIIAGTDAIRYWDESIAGWADITGATYGIDYTLEYLTEGDLAGYTMLTIPGPVTIYVDDSAVGNNDGTSWDDAFNELYDALDVAQDDDKIWVAQGTYRPDTDGLADPRDAAFQMKNGVTIEGGYAGYGTDDPDDRNIELYETILSGDLGIAEDISDNCYHVFYHPEGYSLNSTSILDGFTITGGNAGQGAGGGMYNASFPTITNCTFTGNRAGSGGGIYNHDCDPIITNCKFSNNTATSRGGGIYNKESDPVLTGCTFTGNGNSTYYGGGMYNWHCSPTVTNCL